MRILHRSKTTTYDQTKDKPDTCLTLPSKISTNCVSSVTYDTPHSNYLYISPLGQLNQWITFVSELPGYWSSI